MDFRKETLSGFVGKSASAAVAFAGSIVFARLLDPQIFGAVYLLLAASQVLNKTVTGWASAAKYHISGTRIDVNDAVGAVLLFVFGWVAVVATVAAIFQADVRAYFSLEHSPLYVVAILVSVAVFETVERIAQSLGRIGLSHWLTAVRGVLAAALQIALVVVGFSAFGFVAGWVVGTVVASITGLLLLGLRPTLPTREDVRRLAEYAKSAIPLDLFSTAYNQLDMLLIGYVIGSTVAGDYRIALAVTMPATFMSGVISSGLVTAVSAGESTGNRSPIADIKNSLRYSSLFAVPMFVGSILIAEELVVTAYGAEYADAAILLVALAAFRVIKTQTGPMLSALSGYGRPDLNAKLTAGAVAFNVIVGYLLAVQFGAIGVAIATIVSELLRYAVVRLLVARVSGEAVGVSRNFTMQVGAALVMTLPVYAITEMTNLIGIAEIVPAVSVGAIVYFGVLLLTDAHREAFLGVATDVLNG